MLLSKGGDILQYYAVIPAGDELYHHGVKGMHWGVRRYQNANGSLTSEGRARVKEWKAKEIKRRSAGYTKIERKLDKKSEKLINKRNKRLMKEKDTEKIDEKISKNALNIKINKALQKAEVSKIKKMSLKDIHQAKIDKAKYATKQTLKYVGKTAVAAAGVGASIGVAAGTSTVMAGNLSRLAIKKAAIKGAIGGVASLGLLGASGYGEIRSIKTALGSKKRYSNLTNNEKNTIIANQRAKFAMEKHGVKNQSRTTSLSNERSDFSKYLDKHRNASIKKAESEVAKAVAKNPNLSKKDQMNILGKSIIEYDKRHYK